MARRRLGPPTFSSPDYTPPELEVKAAMVAPPIARIAGQSAAEAALETLAEDMRRAREEGRLVQEIALGDIDPNHLVRDRLQADPEEMTALRESIASRGQQMPIEVVDLGAGSSPRYGLISGWRRLEALKGLLGQDPARFGTVKALLRRPETAAEAYRAMVEENELRVGLSYYERARIAVEAVGQGVFPDRQAALNGLFATASRARKSKIGSFMRIYDALDAHLTFPTAIPERLGLRLAKAIDEGQKQTLIRALEPEFTDPFAEAAALEIALTPAPVSRAKQETEVQDRVEQQGIEVRYRRGQIIVDGPGVTADLAEALRRWLAETL